MREILFKGKRKESGEWVEGELRQDEDLETAYISRWDYYTDDGGWRRDPYEYQIIPETLCQYTGMNDRNGVRIWENDIVKLNNLGYRNRGVYGKVEFNDGCFEVVGDGWRDYLKCYVANHSVEVCGNFFDNPELLEV